MRLPLVGLMCLVACNEIYGLDGTTLRPDDPEIPDRDRDGIADELDRCPGVADPAQADRDGDGFGDACDFCPDIATEVDHDEDADTHGDACDLCPAQPNFQRDADADGIGDDCDNDFATRNDRLLFDPLIELGPHWRVTGTWSLLGDGVTGAADAVLDAETIVIDGSRAFEILVGVTLPAPLVTGPGFALELVDAGGTVVAACQVVCPQVPCNLLQPPTQLTTVTSVPTATFALRRTALGLQACVFGGDVASESDQPAFGTGHLRLRGSPQVQFRFVSVVQ